MKSPLLKLHTLTAIVATYGISYLASAQTIWTGGGGPGSTNWSTSANWSTTIVPASGDSILFTDVGAAVTASNVNSAVEGSVFAGSIAALQYGNTNGTHTTLLVPGQTLTIASALINGTETASDVAKINTITGPGAAVVVNNSIANIIVRQGGGGASLLNRTTLDLSGLDTFSATIARVLIGVGTGGGQNRATGKLILARTNTITASSTTSPAIDVGESGSNNGGGSTLVLGQTNAIFANSITVNRAKESGSSMSFNAAFANAVAYLRAADGASRMSAFIVNDGGSGSGTFGGSGSVDLSGGAVDMQVDNLQVGRANSNTGSTTAKSQTGTLTVKAGIIDVNTLQLGINTAANVNWGNGTLNVNGTALVMVNTVLELGRTAAAATQGGDNTRGVLNINGGTVSAATINANFASTNNIIAITSGALVLTNATLNASAGPGIRTFSITNSTLTLQVQSLTPSVIVTNATFGGATNKLNIASIPVVQGYPAQFVLIKYTTYAGLTNLGLGTLPFSFTPYTGFLSNNFANSSVDLVVTAGPVPARALVWSGTGSPAGDWDIAGSSNWKNNSVPTIFNQTDFVLFDDTASGTTSVNLTTQLDPTSLTVSNVSKIYTFTGAGLLDGAVGVVKQGPGTLIIDNAGVNTFSGGVAISGGKVQFGNNDANGNLPAGNVIDNGVLAFNQVNDLTVPNVISGTGAVTTASGTLRLSAANSFTGTVTVVSGTLIPANNAALGTTNGPTIVSNGGTLDLAGAAGATANSVNLGLEPIVVAGAGVGGLGAIVNNSGTSQQNAIRVVTLAGDTIFGGSGRWDIRGTGATLMSGGQPWKITKTNLNQVSLVGVNQIDPNLGDIHILQGIFALQTSTTQLGDPNKTITIEPQATLDVYQLGTPLNKLIVVNGDGLTHSIYNENGNSFISGPITLNGPCIIEGSGTTLTLSGNVGGAGSLTKTGAGALILNGNVSSAGGVTNSAGTLVLNGVSSVPLWDFYPATLAGSGTCTASVQVTGTLNPGPTNSAGTFTAAAGLGLESGATLTFDLGLNSTIGGTVNDLLEITGDLATTNNAININAWQGRLQAASYRLIDYSGNLLVDALGGLGQPQAIGPSRYSFTLDTSTANQVNLVVSGGSSNLIWASTSSSAWDIASTPNWQDGSNLSDQFYNGDSVLLDDSVAGVTNTLTLASGISVLPWALTNSSSANNYTITGPGKISGPASLVKSGGSTLTIFTTNDYTGPVTVLAGTLRTASSGALGATNSGTTIASGATLDLSSPSTNLAANTLRLGFEPITVSGAGVGGLGAIVNSSTNSQQNALQMVTLAGDTSLGGPGDWTTSTRPGRWDIRSQGNADIAAATNAALSTGGHPYNLTKVGSNWLAIVGVLVDPALANININQGLLSLEHASTLGDPSKTLTVTNGAVLEFWQNWPSNLLNKVIVLYGDGTTKPILINGDGANIFVGPITLNSNCLFAITNSLTLSNNIVGGAGGLTKTGTGPLILWGANNYSGPTVVSSGALSLAGSGSIATSSSITLASNTVVDVTARGDSTLTLAAGQILSGNGSVNGSLTVGPGATVSPGTNGVLGSLNVSNALSLQGDTAMDLVSPGTCDLIRAGGSLSYGGTLSLSFTPGSLHIGDSYKLFNSSSGSYGGSFTITPSTPGSGLKWDTSSLNTAGILVVVQGINLTPTNITTVVTSSNLALSWPLDHLGWHLQAQTNGTGTGLTTNWVEVPGATATNQVFVSIGRTNGSVFYRMFYPTNSP